MNDDTAGNDDLMGEDPSESGQNPRDERSTGDQDQGSKGGQSGSGDQGFASMPDDEVREIAREGGEAAHEKGTAHEWDSDEASEAGKTGGSK